MINRHLNDVNNLCYLNLPDIFDSTKFSVKRSKIILFNR